MHFSSINPNRKQQKKKNSHLKRPLRSDTGHIECHYIIVCLTCCCCLFHDRRHIYANKCTRFGGRGPTKKKSLLIMVRYAALKQINCSPLVSHTGTHRQQFLHLCLGSIALFNAITTRDSTTNRLITSKKK